MCILCKCSSHSRSPLFPNFIWHCYHGKFRDKRLLEQSKVTKKIWEFKSRLNSAISSCNHVAWWCHSFACLPKLYCTIGNKSTSKSSQRSKLQFTSVNRSNHLFIYLPLKAQNVDNLCLCTIFLKPWPKLLHLFIVPLSSAVVF